MKKEVKGEYTKTKKIKLRYKNILRFLIFIIILGFIAYEVLKLPISNIYISGNSILSDQEIIDIAELSNYPSTLENTSQAIKNKLEKNEMVISAKVEKKQLFKVYIDIVENRPLFYNSNTDKIVMLDKSTKDGSEVAPYLINYVPDTIYDKFIDGMGKIDIDILNRISEIQYDPNEVDTERFYLTMTDGNYVYLTLSDFSKINNYVNMIKQFLGKKGVLYLDSGEYFEVR